MNTLNVTARSILLDSNDTGRLLMINPLFILRPPFQRMAFVNEVRSYREIQANVEKELDTRWTISGPNRCRHAKEIAKASWIKVADRLEEKAKNAVWVEMKWPQFRPVARQMVLTVIASDYVASILIAGCISEGSRSAFSPVRRRSIKVKATRADEDQNAG